MSLPALDSVFPVIVVNFGAKGDSTILNSVDDRVVFQCTEDQKSTIRFDVQTGRLNVWITDAANADEHPYAFQIQLAHARLAGMTESEVEFEGVEVDSFKMTGRVARVILTNATSGWVHD